MEKKRKSRETDVITALQMATKMNFAMSFLVPVKKGEHILDAAFLYGTGSFSVMRTRPFASILMEPNTKALLEYRNAYFDDFMDSAQYPMALKLDYSVPYASSAKEQGELVRKVQELYGSIRALPWKDGLDVSEKEMAMEYDNCFYRAVPRALLPFYEALSPEFFAWLKQQEG